jgi:periplasmic protein CpxP/Spy
METIKKYKSLVIIIVFLLVTNVAMLIFFMAISKPIDKRSSGRFGNTLYNEMQNNVGFSKDQLDQYQSLRTENRSAVKPLFENVSKAKENFYNLLYNENAPDSLINSYADSIAQSQRILDLQMLRHFKKVRSLCTTDQLPKFDTAIKKVVMRMISRPGKGKTSRS